MKLPENFLNADDANKASVASENYKQHQFENITNIIVEATKRGAFKIQYSNVPSDVLNELIIHGYKISEYDKTISWLP